MMRYALPSPPWSAFAVPTFKSFVDLHRIGVDDLAAKLFGQGHGKSGFAGGGGPADSDHAAVLDKASKLFFQLLPGDFQHAGTAVGAKRRDGAVHDVLGQCQHLAPRRSCLPP